MWSHEPLAPNALEELAVFQRGALDQYLTYSHEKGVMYRAQTNADPYHDPMKVACAGFRIEELRIQLDAFFEHVDERVEESNVHKTAAKEKLLELEAEITSQWWVRRCGPFERYLGCFARERPQACSRVL